MSISELYQEVILDHTKNPRNRRKMVNANRNAEGYNPLCGDQVTLHVSLDGNVLRDISFEGSGCAISTASVSLLTETLKGKTAEEVKTIFKSFHDLVTGQPTKGDLGKLEVFSGVQEFPMRVKCATLAWHTLNAALDNKENKKEPITTEGVEDK